MSIPYRNPVHEGSFADPFVMTTEDGYLAVGTGSAVEGRQFELLTSPDLVHWTSIGGALDPVQADLGSDYWAPEIAEHEGRWFLYYSVGHGDRGHHLRVAVADEATGPYRDAGVNLTPDERFAIDPHPFRDDDGTWYLFFAHDVLEGERVGTMLAVDILDSMTSLRGAARTILPPSQDWQIFLRDREMYGQVYDWHTLEGPFVRRRDGRYYLFYSGGSWLEPTYGVAYAVADHPLGPWTEPTDRPPLLRTVPGRVIGPGHNSVVAGKSDTDDIDVMIYHAWDPDQTKRRLCIDPIVWTADAPTVDGPSWEPRELPWSPA
jgi:beta-xylosidase